MKQPERSLAIVIVLGFTFAMATSGAATSPLTTVSQPAGLHVTMQSELEPVTINQMHTWIISVHDTQGEAINDAVIQVDGGMPLHNHGLATSPQVTGQPGEGRYRLQGVRFHMNGEWELRLQIEHAGVPYQATFTLTL
ncbi:FixH family protein [Pseudohongiella sp.]|uniref:YtkA-like domain-containing protein n=1 Tax=marine sediment metagenome TaxID=412755 RepID=A0A0F9XIS1_9ZZZZ|nr:FixH family protein [Pseudohongiella sp.]HDZ08900.1 auxin-binding protein [Pseudohongiella sp.]HEA64022.1 auxin-binding protein [Pseudohongiella sp.]